MSGDYSRFVYDPRRDYNGVLLQQGRPLTDWDWNDLVAQSNRRAQATSFDTFGGVPVVPITTPDGFKLALTGSQLTIGRGRIYVDGLLAENHGLAAKSGLAWDAALAELHGTQPVPYDQQPYLPNAPALPESGGPHLVYVDVWQREIGYLTAPDLVDKAVGVDATTRLQTVWQVKALAADRGERDLGCDTPLDDIPGWTGLTAPSAGRLTTGTASFGTDNPCLIPPSGGYTGLENQLYRVEIHDGGKPGTATFKWSRDNASVQTRVSAFVDASTLQVESIGRDQVLGFNDGDWIEIVDDWLELANQPGELRRIVSGGGVDNATRTIALEKPVTAGLFNVDPAAGRNTRIRRWDQKGQVLRTDVSPPAVVTDLGASTSAGAIPVPASGAIRIGLESGIVACFDVASADGVFKSGDWWVFAARTSVASVELLDRAPPRGIHHHYARLGLYTPGSENQPTDCRQFWPPSFGSESCACTICVSPQSHAQSMPSLQQAIDTVIASGGGTVCIEAGDYLLDRPLRIEKARTLALRGQGLAARLTGAAASIAIVGSNDVTLEGFAIVPKAGESAKLATITVQDSQNLRLHQLLVESRVRSGAGVAIALAGKVVRMQVTDNLIGAGFGIYSVTDVRVPSRVGPVLIEELAIDGNVFRCIKGAIDLQLTAQLAAAKTTSELDSKVKVKAKTEASAVAAPAVDSLVRIRGNRIEVSGGHGIALAGAGLSGESIEITGNRIEVVGNGISAGLFDLRILDNDVVHGDSEDENSAVGILLPQAAEGEKAVAGDCQLIGNHVVGFGGAAIRAEALLGLAQIRQNQLRRCGAGIEVINGRVAQLSIENNQIVNIEANGSDAEQTQLAGISVANAQILAITGNSIAAVGLQSTSPNLQTAGVLVQACNATRITGNELVAIGPRGMFSGTVYGILARAPLSDVVVDGNHVRRDSVPGEADASIWFGVVISGVQAQAAGMADSFRGFAAMPEPLKRMVADVRPGTAVAETATAVATPPGKLPRVGIQGNQVTARGGGFAVAVLTTADCNFSNNHSIRTSTAGETVDFTLPDVYLIADTVIAGGNRIVGPKGSKGLSMVIQVNAEGGHYTVLGNITSGEIHIGSAALPAPWSALNVHAA